MTAHLVQRGDFNPTLALIERAGASEGADQSVFACPLRHWDHRRGRRRTAKGIARLLDLCDAVLVGRAAFPGSVDAERPEPSSHLNPEAEINAAVDGVAVDDSRVSRSVAVLKWRCCHASDVALMTVSFFPA